VRATDGAGDEATDEEGEGEASEEMDGDGPEIEPSGELPEEDLAVDAELDGDLEAGEAGEAEGALEEDR
jgi:hypothetical protein